MKYRFGIMPCLSYITSKINIIFVFVTVDVKTCGSFYYVL